MIEAICAVKNGMSKRSAAFQFNVPRATLIQKLKNRGKNPILQKVGRSTCLETREEKYLAEQIKKLIDCGAVKSDDHVLNLVQQFANKLDRPNPFLNGRPSIKWLHSFTTRYSYLKTFANNMSKSSVNVSHCTFLTIKIVSKILIVSETITYSPKLISY